MCAQVSAAQETHNRTKTAAAAAATDALRKLRASSARMLGRSLEEHENITAASKRLQPDDPAAVRKSRAVGRGRGGRGPRG